LYGSVYFPQFVKLIIDDNIVPPRSKWITGQQGQPSEIS
jgi:hypothetical protein